MNLSTASTAQDRPVDDAILAILPKRLAELVSVIGLPAALKIVKLRGGGRLEVPRRAKPEHWLVEHIGLEALVKLVKYYDGERIEIDKFAGLDLVIKERAIVAEFADGASNWDLAQRYNMTERGIRILRKRAGAAKPCVNVDLFADFL